MADSQVPGLRATVQEQQSSEGRRVPPVPAAALPLPVTKVSTGPATALPRPPRTAPHNENQEFRRSGLLPSRDSNLQRQERRMFLWIFMGMILLFGGLLTVIMVSRI